MKSEPRLIQFLQTLFGRLNQKLFFLKTNFSLSLFYLFIGFLAGNLFGTFLTSIRSVIPWDGFIVLVLLVCFELISYQVYHRGLRPSRKATRSFLIGWKPASAFSLWKQLNYLKIGLLLGFFIDAFKVGS